MALYPSDVSDFRKIHSQPGSGNTTPPIPNQQPEGLENPNPPVNRCKLLVYGGGGGGGGNGQIQPSIFNKSV